MTERKPAGTSWESGIVAQIRVAQEQGASDNLPGAGKALHDRGHVHDPLRAWVKELAEREQLTLLPPSLELLRKAKKELAALEKLPDEATVRRRIAALNVEIGKLNATVVEGPPTASASSTSIRSWRAGGGRALPIPDSVSPHPNGRSTGRCPCRRACGNPGNRSPSAGRDVPAPRRRRSSCGSPSCPS